MLSASALEESNLRTPDQPTTWTMEQVTLKVESIESEDYCGKRKAIGGNCTQHEDNGPNTNATMGNQTLRSVIAHQPISGAPTSFPAPFFMPHDAEPLSAAIRRLEPLISKRAAAKGPHQVVDVVVRLIAALPGETNEALTFMHNQRYSLVKPAQSA